MKPLTLIDKTFLLKKTPLFGSLDLDMLLPIADKLGVVSFSSGETIFSIGDEAHLMYIIFTGKIEVINEDKQLLEELNAGDFFGDESLFNDKPRMYKAISLTDSTLFTLTRTNLLTIISEYPNVALGFMQAYTLAFPFIPKKR